MFYRGNVQRRKFLKPRSHKKKPRPNQPEWDNTIHDLTVHAASHEEVVRRQLRHKSKNADRARRELVAKRRGLPVDLVLSPGQVELEMKKLAILREVLYDQNDFNEVLKKTDETMASVKNIFHDSVSRKSGRPNITLAPGSKKPPPIQPDKELPSKLDILSDSVMDSKALNEQSSDESEYEDNVKFESKVDYDRFMALLKDSMNNTRYPQDHNETGVTTPVKGPPANGQAALNCTQEVKRTLSRISSIKDEDESLKRKEEARKIDQVIIGIRKDTSKLEKSLNASKIQQPDPIRSLPNVTQCNMSYEDLQGAMANVQKQLQDFEARTGRNSNQSKPATSNGLAGFTVTLIDSVTRLTTYVNEGELRTQALEQSLDDLTKKLQDQVQVNEALASELVNTQKVIKQNQDDIATLQKELKENKEKNYNNQFEELEKKIEQLKKSFNDLESKLLITEHTLVEGGDTPVDIPMMESKKTDNCIGDFVIQQTSNNADNKEETALKNDMIRLLNALKTQNEKTASQRTITPPEPNIFDITENTFGAAKTIASVESHLRHLQLQHAEAQQRMNELTKQAQMHSYAKEPSWNRGYSHAIPTSSPSHSVASSSLPSDSDSLATVPIHIPPESKPLVQQTNIFPFNDTGSQTSSVPLCPVNLKPSMMTDINDFPDFESDIGSFKVLEPDSATDTTINSILTSPQVAEQQQQAMLTTIQQTQMSLEDRIAELNRQHSQAQERLQKLVARRKIEKQKDQPTKRVQISLPSVDMLNTPHAHSVSST